ncbi:hypothetical protein [uncultured Nocardioides sp.]|nr:hypothetical protein [uncultured Nocardioides sp.]
MSRSAFRSAQIAKQNTAMPQQMSTTTCSWRHHTMSVAPGTA